MVEIGEPNVVTGLDDASSCYQAMALSPRPDSRLAGPDLLQLSKDYYGAAMVGRKTPVACRQVAIAQWAGVTTDIIAPNMWLSYRKMRKRVDGWAAKDQ